MTQSYEAKLALAEARAAQRGESANVASFKQDLLDSEGQVGLDLVKGLEFAATGEQAPRDTAEIDAGWRDFEARQHEQELTKEEMVEHLTALGEENVLQAAIRSGEEALGREEIIEAGLRVVVGAPNAYGEWLDNVDPSERWEIDQDVRAAFAAIADNKRETEFQQQLQASAAENTAHAKQSLAELQASREMSEQDLQRLDRAFTEASGVPLRTALETIMPEQRSEFLRELAVQQEASERGARLQKLAASFFTPDTSIESGLTIRGQSYREIPPVALNRAYAEFRAEQQIRAEDESRQARPQPQTVAQLKADLLAPESRDWREGLTDSAGRKTSFEELAAQDPDSARNQEARARARARRVW